MKSRRTHTVIFLYHFKISVCVSTGRHVAALLSSCSVVIQTNLLNESIEMVIQTSEHFSNKHFAIFAIQPNLRNFHFAKCSPLNGKRLVLNLILKYKSQILHFEKHCHNLVLINLLYIVLFIILYISLLWLWFMSSLMR